MEDDLHQLKFEENSVRSLDEVRARLTETHEQLLDYLDNVPDELLHSRERFRTRLCWDTCSHYPMHAEQTRKWRAGIKRDQDPGKCSSDME